MLELTYFIMLAFFITHELDAIKRHEWRILPLISSLHDNIGEQVFIWAHIPLFAVIFVLGGLDPKSVTAYCLSAFSIIHMLLHYYLRKAPKYEFNNISSVLIITGAGFFGGLHILYVSFI